ncbi:MAG: peptide transporter, partial [Muribaculaceae bacterium]|nr:peptide transporter [Muribaculaceae bacterium]
NDRGTLIASGLMAGGALFGVFAALTRYLGFEFINETDAVTLQIAGVVMYAMLIGYFLWDSCRVDKKPERD